MLPPPLELAVHLNQVTNLTPRTSLLEVKAGGGKKRQRSIAPPSVPDREQGLRNFSLKVCTVVQTRRETSYTDVADTLVDDIVGHQRAQGEDGRNIRRCAAVLLSLPLCSLMLPLVSSQASL